MQPLSRRDAAVDEIVRDGLARAETLTRDYRVEHRRAPRLPPLSVDAASIVEVLYILLDNASKYAPPGSTIRVSASLERRPACRAGGGRRRAGRSRSTLREQRLREILPRSRPRVARSAAKRHRPRAADCPAARRSAGRANLDRVAGFGHGHARAAACCRSAAVQRRPASTRLIPATPAAVSLTATRE